jgi:hypothetical protein
MEGTKKIFTGKSRTEVDAKLQVYLGGTEGKVHVLGVDYLAPEDGTSGHWLLILSHHITFVDDSCSPTNY